MYTPYKNVGTEVKKTLLEWCKLDKKSVIYHKHPEWMEKYNGTWI